MLLYLGVSDIEFSVFLVSFLVFFVLVCWLIVSLIRWLNRH